MFAFIKLLALSTISSSTAITVTHNTYVLVKMLSVDETVNSNTTDNASQAVSIAHCQPSFGNLFLRHDFDNDVSTCLQGWIKVPIPIVYLSKKDVGESRVYVHSSYKETCKTEEEAAQSRTTELV